MKRMMTLVLAAVLAGCAARPAETDDTPVPEETAETEAVIWEEEKTEDTGSVYDLLAGEWALMPGGIPAEDPDIILKISSADPLVTVSRNSTSEAVAGTFVIGEHTSEAPDGLMTISFFGSRPANMTYAIESYFRIRLAETDGREVLVLRESGDGNRFMAEEFLKYETRTEDGSWFFERTAGSKQPG